MYKCPLCSKKFLSLKSLDRHLRRVHNISYFNLTHGYQLNVVIRVRISEVDKSILEDEAAKLGLDLSNLIRNIIRDYIRRNRLRSLRPT